jgi:hypothetical protein
MDVHMVEVIRMADECSLFREGNETLDTEQCRTAGKIVRNDREDEREEKFHRPTVGSSTSFCTTSHLQHGL